MVRTNSGEYPGLVLLTRLPIYYHTSPPGFRGHQRAPVRPPARPRRPQLPLASVQVVPDPFAAATTIPTDLTTIAVSYLTASMSSMYTKLS